MAIKIISKTNTDPVSATFPYGDFRDNPGNNTGTPVNLDNFGDYVQWFAKMMAESNVTYNDLRDNATNGWQYYEAFRDHINKFGALNVLTSSVTMSSNAFDSITVGFNASAISLTLPVAGTDKITRRFTVLNGFTGTVTLLPGTNTINTGSSIILEQGDSVEFFVSAANSLYVLRINRRTIAPTNATLLNSWTGTAQYMRSGESNVLLRGTIDGVTGVVGVIFMNLPAGFRPTNAKTLLVHVYNVTAAVVIPATITIGTNGDITWTNLGGFTLGDTVRIYLDGIQFYTGW